MEYSPLPPMMPISACKYCSCDESELVILNQRRDHPALRQASDRALPHHSKFRNQKLGMRSGPEGGDQTAQVACRARRDIVGQQQLDAIAHIRQLKRAFRVKDPHKRLRGKSRSPQGDLGLGVDVHRRRQCIKHRQPSFESNAVWFQWSSSVGQIANRQARDSLGTLPRSSPL